MAFLFWPKLPHVPTAAVNGPVSLTVTQGSFAALGAIY